ncbi:hypothetical protein [Psychroserpens sp. NJDZ02]|uniref:hypothetical protein n=1 Tax=Psychroserpens sp. NJDZ02 TaxID=2570561 RepID=UPI0010A7D262|nr:hypothetical protein [Psychroserpens sp. NJDZ02]QCE42775.1 hypothetical protein E9099_15605 [Psychroserpens sp. NJDZ02]
MPLIKKQISLLFFLFTIFYTNAQEEKIYYGSPSTRGAEFHFKEDNSYNIILKEGTHDTFDTGRETVIFIDNIGYDIEGFHVTEDYAEVIKDSITVNFYRRGLDSKYENYYLGFKVKGDKNFTYLNLSYETLFFNTEKVEPFAFNGYLSIKIPRTTEIQFIFKEEVTTKNEDKKETYIMNQFSLSKNAANAFVDQRVIRDKNNIFNSKFAVAEIYGSTRKILDIDNKAFSSLFTPSTYVKRTKIDSFTNWKIPAEVKKEVYKKFNNPKYEYNPVITISPSSRNEAYKKYEFNHLKEAVAAVKADDSKVLLVFNSLLRNNDITYFNYIFYGIYSDAEKSYLSEYNYDKFLVYYIKPEDLTELSKYRQESTDEVFALNSDLDIVYTEAINTERFYYKYHGIDQELSENLLAIKELNKLKRKLTAKSTTAKDFLNLGKQRYHDFIDVAITKREKSADELRIESQIHIIGESKNAYPGFKTNVQYFYPQIDYKDIRQELDRLVEAHKKDTTIDFDYAKLAFDFITVESFFDDIAGEKGNYAPTKIYYEFCLYLSRFPVETSKIHNKSSERFSQNQYATIREILKSRHGDEAMHPALVTAIYENLNNMESEKYYSIFYYYIYLYNNQKLSIEKFDALVNEVAPLDDNFTEQLESFYRSCECIYIDDMTYLLSTLGNAMAWDVVTKNNTDKSLLEKARKWSKISVELSPDSHYYVDTLANLEYFLGNKDSAMALESKAIQMATESNHENLAEYKTTLEKIKRNTLTH